MVNADLLFDDDLAPGRRWASMRLLKQQRAFTAKLVSATIVMDKCINRFSVSSTPRKKTAPAALLILLLSRETWLSESP